MEFSPEQKEMIAAIGGDGWEKRIPVDQRRYKCHLCHHILLAGDLVEGACPTCGNKDLPQVCPLDHCHCGESIVDGIEYCSICGEPMCPKCGSHDIAQLSRVTGYLQEVSGWNAAKQQELKDRKRYDVAIGAKP